MQRPRLSIFYVNVLVVATCGLIYELLAGTLASYVLGDSVTQFSLVIGLYLSALGVGAFLSRWVEKRLVEKFLEVELLVALLGGGSAPILWLAFGRTGHFHAVLYGVVVSVGTLVGLELPLLMRILKEQLDFKDLVARVLSFDYLGALVASILFPVLFVPKLGLTRTSLVFGAVNAGIALWGTWSMRPLLHRPPRALRVRAAVVLAALVAGVWQADRLTELAEENLYADEIIYTKSSPYQRIVVTRGRGGFQLFLNGNLQFASADEARYHEALVHPALLAAGGAARRVLVLGGGDGLALREILKWPQVAEVTLVDLDPDMTRLADHFPPLGELNRQAFHDPRVRVVNADAMAYLGAAPADAAWDAAIVDFPDPNNFALGKLYTTRFYRLLRAHLAPDAAIAVQSTSPLFARSAYWCIVRTIEAAGFSVQPYWIAVPSFGVWGFTLARLRPFAPPATLAGAPPDLHVLTEGTLAAMFVFSADMAPVSAQPNRLDNQLLVRSYEREWRRWD